MESDEFIYYGRPGKKVNLLDQPHHEGTDLYDIAIFDISRDGEQWRKYLEFSARGNLYRFDFLNTCIIYEQYPEAEILLGFSDWKKAKRYVRGGEIGIATFPIEMLGGAQYVYDIKSTGGRVMPWIWEINEENAPAFAKRLFPEQYQEENNFRIAIKNFTRTYVRAIMEEENDRIHEIAVLTSKDELDDKQMSPVEEFILQSTAYLVLRRCGIDTFDTGLSAITNYQEEVILSKIGILISDIAERTLRRFAEIAKEIREDERRNQDGRTDYRKEKDGLLYPMLETGSQQAEGLETLGRYAKLAQEYLLEKEESRYSLLLRTGKLPELLKQIEAEAWELHDQIVEDYVRIKAVERNINPADTME